jgi:hypothetical protein
MAFAHWKNTKLHPATLTVATPATIEENRATFKPTVAEVATVAVATSDSLKSMNVSYGVQIETFAANNGTNNTVTSANSTPYTSPLFWSDRYRHLITCQQCEHLTLTGYCRVKSLTKPMPDAMRECTKFNQLTNERTKISNVPYTQSELNTLITHCKNSLLSHLAQCPRCKISHPHFCTDASAINSDYEAMLLCFESADMRQDYLITPY